MLTIGITLGIWLVVDVAWTTYLFNLHRERIKLYRVMDLSSDSVKAHAEQLLRDARKLMEKSKLQQEHKVCPVCERITTKHVTHTDGKTRCVNCHADMLNGFAAGVKING
jgi:uncharacterized paraquat-inducible protein A